MPSTVGPYAVGLGEAFGTTGKAEADRRIPAWGGGEHRRAGDRPGSSGGIGQLAAALDAVSAGWVLTALLAMLVGYLLLALHLRRLASGEISL